MASLTKSRISRHSDRTCSSIRDNGTTVFQGCRCVAVAYPRGSRRQRPRIDGDEPRISSLSRGERLWIAQGKPSRPGPDAREARERSGRSRSLESETWLDRRIGSPAYGLRRGGVLFIYRYGNGLISQVLGSTRNQNRTVSACHALIEQP